MPGTSIRFSERSFGGVIENQAPFDRSIVVVPCLWYAPVLTVASAWQAFVWAIFPVTAGPQAPTTSRPGVSASIAGSVPLRDGAGPARERGCPLSAPDGAADTRNARGNDHTKR